MMDVNNATALREHLQRYRSVRPGIGRLPRHIGQLNNGTLDSVKRMQLDKHAQTLAISSLSVVNAINFRASDAFITLGDDRCDTPSVPLTSSEANDDWMPSLSETSSVCVRTLARSLVDDATDVGVEPS